MHCFPQRLRPGRPAELFTILAQRRKRLPRYESDPSFDYSLIYGERTIRSVLTTHARTAASSYSKPSVFPSTHTCKTFAFYQVNEALIALKNDAIRGAGVLRSTTQRRLRYLSRAPNAAKPPPKSRIDAGSGTSKL